MRLKVDVIFAQAAPAIRAAKQATKTIPIVFEMLADPVSAGFAASLARPGGNLTGVGGLAPELSGKRLELLKEIVPRLTLVAVLANPANPQFAHMLKNTETAASALKLRPQVVEIKDRAKFDDALSRMLKAPAEALSVVPDPMLIGELKTLVTSPTIIDCRPSTACQGPWKTAYLWLMRRAKPKCFAVRLTTSIGYSKEQNPRISRSSSRRNSSC